MISRSFIFIITNYVTVVSLKTPDGAVQNIQGIERNVASSLKSVCFVLMSSLFSYFFYGGFYLGSAAAPPD